jgi:hypothetical protein
MFILFVLGVDVGNLRCFIKANIHSINVGTLKAVIIRIKESGLLKPRIGNSTCNINPTRIIETRLTPIEKR